MATARMDIEEKVRIGYEINYNEVLLEERGFNSLAEYIKAMGGNPWICESTEDVIMDIAHLEIVDYPESYYDTVQINE